MYINETHIAYYAVFAIIGLFVGMFIDWMNKRLPEYKKVFSKEIATEYTHPPIGSGNGTNRVLLKYILPKGYKVSETGKMGIAMSRGIPQIKNYEAMLPAGCVGELVSKVKDKDGLLKLTFKMLLK